MTPDPGDLDRVARAALEEDLRYGPDITTAAVIPSGIRSVADIVARQPGTLAGLPVAAAVLDVACPAATFTPQARDGDQVAAGDMVARVEGPLAEILTAERTLLNFLTHLSGIATATRAWVDAITGTGAIVRDTRKTIPGLRALEKYAVRCGGGVNHRMGLGDAALIKDNHVAAAGGVAAAFHAVRAAAPGVAIEVECDTLDQVGEALAAGAALILLDNMSLDQMRSAVAMARAYPTAKLEASGGLRLENARDVASTGVHYLSVGALTHSSPALDIALDVGLLRIAAAGTLAARNVTACAVYTRTTGCANAPSPRRHPVTTRPPRIPDHAGARQAGPRHAANNYARSRRAWQQGLPVASSAEAPYNRASRMRIVDIRKRPIRISRCRDPHIPPGGLIISLVAVVTDVAQSGRPAVGYGFASIGRHAQSGLIRGRHSTSPTLASHT
jgi:nicotinate-nucleotide pyrophosphorylase (carboxylating)